MQWNTSTINQNNHIRQKNHNSGEEERTPQLKDEKEASPNHPPISNRKCVPLSSATRIISFSPEKTKQTRQLTMSHECVKTSLAQGYQRAKEQMYRIAMKKLGVWNTSAVLSIIYNLKQTVAGVLQCTMKEGGWLGGAGKTPLYLLRLTICFIATLLL